MPLHNMIKTAIIFHVSYVDLFNRYAQYIQILPVAFIFKTIARTIQQNSLIIYKWSE